VITTNHSYYVGNPGDVLEWRRRLRANGRLNLNLQSLSFKRCMRIKPRILNKLISLFGGQRLPKLILEDIKLNLDGKCLKHAMINIAQHCRSCVFDVELAGTFEARHSLGNTYIAVHRDQMLNAFHGCVT
jgi:hypothetical protein